MSKMNKVLGTFVVFVGILLIAFFAVGFADTVTAPDNSTVAGMQYENLSKTVSIADSGLNAVLLLIIMGMLIAAIVGAIQMIKR